MSEQVAPAHGSTHATQTRPPDDLLTIDLQQESLSDNIKEQQNISKDDSRPEDAAPGSELTVSERGVPVDGMAQAAETIPTSDHLTVESDQDCVGDTLDECQSISQDVSKSDDVDAESEEVRRRSSESKVGTNGNKHSFNNDNQADEGKEGSSGEGDGRMEDHNDDDGDERKEVVNNDGGENTGDDNAGDESEEDDNESVEDW
ncbi:hypothetical protein HDU76_003182 [Blyttiomyces sp. JEL0837]|nr:hypothetical protein HDU76_003182 [Blyttiomyces sp. JEL0837]